MNTKGSGGVYAIRNTVTGEQYIGSTRHFGKRRGMHLFLLGKGRHYNPGLQAAYDLYGRDVLAFDVVESMGIEPDRDHLFEREQHYLSTLTPAYNVCPSSQGSAGRPIKPETHARMSDGQRRRAPVSAETRAKRSENQRRKMADPAYKAMIAEKVSASQRGRKMAPEHRAKVAEAARRRDNTRLREMAQARRGKAGHPHTADARARMSEAAYRRYGRERPALPEGVPSARALGRHGRVPQVPVLEATA